MENNTPELELSPTVEAPAADETRHETPRKREPDGRRRTKGRPAGKHRSPTGRGVSHGRRRRRRRKEDPTLKIINAVLLLLVGIGLAVCAYTGYQYVTFSTQPYDAQVSSLQEETARVELDMETLRQELDREEKQLRADLRQAGEEGAAAADALAKAREENDALHAENDALHERAEFVKNIYENTLALREEYAGKIRELEDLIVAGQSGVKICYWSFDDGPGNMTSAILDFCAENNLYVTFFTSREANETGQGDVDEPALLRRETMLGHSVQNHTNSHQYSKIAGNLYTKGLDSFKEQVRLQGDWVYENTGFRPDIFRFPGGSAWAFTLIAKDQLLGALDELGYVWVDWACDVMDNLHANPDAATVSARATWQIKQINPPIAIILSHDWNVNTYYGFMRAVPLLQQQGYIFLPLFSQSWAIDNTEIKFS